MSDTSVFIEVHCICPCWVGGGSSLFYVQVDNRVSTSGGFGHYCTLQVQEALFLNTVVSNTKSKLFVLALPLSDTQSRGSLFLLAVLEWVQQLLTFF